MPVSPTFEEELFPYTERWEYARGNVAGDVARLSGRNQQTCADAADRLYTGWREVEPCARMGVLNLLIPVGCNARCPGICYTDVAKWRRRPEHLTDAAVLDLLETARACGMRIVRVVGDGEPVLNEPLMLQMTDWADTHGIAMIVFSNGLRFSEKMIKRYRQSEQLHFYIKLWSEDSELQNRLVAPHSSYHYVDGELGLAPEVFYRLYEASPDRVGFQVMVSTLNMADAVRIVSGVKARQPLFIEPFIPAGAGVENSHLVAHEWPPMLAETKGCTRPVRASYLGVVDSSGHLLPGTFVPQGAVDLKTGSLREYWSSVHVERPTFYQARYGGDACFCAAMRAGQNSRLGPALPVLGSVPTA